LQPGYTRAHLTRIGSLSTSGRVRFTMTFPDDPMALALPFDHGRALRGELVTASTWQTSPVPILGDLRVQPRTLSMFRSEQYVDLGGSIRMVADGTGRRIDNATGLDLQDALIVEKTESGLQFTPIGNLGSGASATLSGAIRDEMSGVKYEAPLDPNPFFQLFSHSIGDRPEDWGEVRLVAWLPGHRPGVRLDPGVDRHRGLTMVVVHLAYPAVPGPDGPRFDGREASTISSAPAAVDPPPGPAEESDQPDQKEQPAP
jgi:hypothetical protein